MSGFGGGLSSSTSGLVVFGPHSFDFLNSDACLSLETTETTASVYSAELDAAVAAEEAAVCDFELPVAKVSLSRKPSKAASAAAKAAEAQRLAAVAAARRRTNGGDAELSAADAIFFEEMAASAALGDAAPLPKHETLSADIAARASILSGAPGHFNQDVEKRRRFGAAATALGGATTDDNAGNSGRSRRRPPPQASRSSRFMARLSSHRVPAAGPTLRRKGAYKRVVPRKPEWVMPSPGLFSLVRVPAEELARATHISAKERSECAFFRFIGSDDFSAKEADFMGAGASYDPNSLVAFARANPDFPIALLQVSHLMESLGDFAAAAELTQQSLAVLESSFPPGFSLYSGTCRLLLAPTPAGAAAGADADVADMAAAAGADDPTWSASASLGLTLLRALGRHAHLLAKAAAPHTALEFAKAALSLSPAPAPEHARAAAACSSFDPACTLQLLDYYALRSERWGWAVKAARGLDPVPGSDNGSQLLYAGADGAGAEARARGEIATLDTVGRAGDVDAESGARAGAVAFSRGGPGSQPSFGYVRPAFLPNWSFSAALAQRKRELAVVAAAAAEQAAAAAAAAEADAAAAAAAEEEGRDDDDDEWEVAYLSASSRRAAAHADTAAAAVAAAAAAKTAAAAAAGDEDTEGVSGLDAGAWLRENESCPVGVPMLQPGRGAADAASSAYLLQRAIALFPEVVTELAPLLGSGVAARAPWVAILEPLRQWYKSSPQTERLARIYAERCAVVWRADAAQDMLLAAGQAVVAKWRAGAWSVAAMQRVRDALFPANTLLPHGVRMMQKSDYTDVTPTVPDELLRGQADARQRAAVVAGGQDDGFIDLSRPNVALDPNSGFLSGLLQSLLPWVTAPDGTVDAAAAEAQVRGMLQQDLGAAGAGAEAVEAVAQHIIGALGRLAQGARAGAGALAARAAAAAAAAGGAGAGPEDDPDAAAFVADDDEDEDEDDGEAQWPDIRPDDLS